MALTNPFPGVSGVTTTTDARKALAGLLLDDASGNVRAGIFPVAGGTYVTARADMNVDIAAFQGAAVQFGGPILITNDGVAQLPSVLVSPGSGNNFYVVYAKQNESTSPGTDASNTKVFGAALSTASFAAARALLPTGAIELATVQIPSGVSATNAGGVTITQTAQLTCAEGGALPARTLAELNLITTMRTGQYADVFADSTAGNNGLYRWSGSAWVQWLGDTGWITPSLSSGWSVSGGLTPQYRRLNGQVFMHGRIAGGTSAAVFTLPAGFRPAQNLVMSVNDAASTTATDRLTVNTDGTVVPVTTQTPNLVIPPFPADA